MDVDCPSFAASAVIINIVCLMKKVLRAGSRSIVRKRKKSILSRNTDMQLASPLEENVLHRFKDTFLTALAARGGRRTCVSIDKDKLCFETALKTNVALTECLNLDEIWNAPKTGFLSIFGLDLPCTLEWLDGEMVDGTESEHPISNPRFGRASILYVCRGKPQMERN